MRKSYYTNGYTNDHDPTYYRDSYEQAIDDLTADADDDGRDGPAGD